MHELGTGVLTWPANERRSDRYGCVFLLTSFQGDESLPLNKTIEGREGRLVALVKEIRKSQHIGDLSHGVFPTTPEIGQEIVLGEGQLFFGEKNTVGLRPKDNRETLWLDINALYNAHDQTVVLYFDG